MVSSFRVNSMMGIAILACGFAIFGSVVPMSTSVVAQEPAQDDNPGIKYLDEATDLRLKKLESPDDLGKLMAAAEKAIEVGLDDSNKALAKEMIAAAAYQRAQLTYSSIIQARNPASLRRLRTSMVNDLNKAIENDPKLAEAYIMLGLIEDGAKAGEVLTKAIELFKDDPAKQSRAYVMRGSKVGTPEEKLADFRKAVQIDDTNSEGWQVLIALQSKMGKLEEALNDAKAMLAKDAENPFAIKAILGTLLALERNDEALVFLNEKLDKLPNSPELLVQRADLLIKANRGEDALTDLNKAIEMDPRNGQALLQRCQVRMAAGEFDKAEQDVEDVLILAPEQPLALYYRSLIAANQKRMPDAIADLLKVIQLAPDSAEFKWQLGTFYQLDNRPRKAIAIADEIVKSQKENWKTFHVRALRMRGDARLSLGEHKEAIQDFEQALKILGDAKQDGDEADKDGERSGLLNNLAWVLSTSPVDEVRDGQRSIRLGLEACELTDYKESHILSTLASGYAEAGNFEEAIKWAEKAVEAGEREKYAQLDQLKRELESYQQKKPWREKQETKDKKAPIVPSSGGVDT